MTIIELRIFKLSSCEYHRLKEYKAIRNIELWSQQESNLHLKFRKLLFYPLNYGTSISKKKELIAEFLYFVAGTRLERATFGL